MHLDDTKNSTRGFTLIELLMVVLIIGVLVAVGLSVGGRVIEGGKATQTKDLLKSLEQVLNSYEQTTDRLPPGSIIDPRQPEGAPTGTILHMPLADAWDNNNDRIINSVGLFLAEARRVEGVSSLLDGFDARNYRLFRYTAGLPDPAPGSTEPELMTVIDAWGQPIRFVHPAFHGVRRTAERVADILGPAPAPASAFFPAEIRRDPARNDADGGMTTNGRPYFYSVGPDGRAGSVDDNVYLVEPRIQN